MMIPVNEPQLNGNEEKYLIECIRTGWISSEGPFIKKFEEQLADPMGVEVEVAVYRNFMQHTDCQIIRCRGTHNETH
jgi:dTDP-4-amino-4,6-dideoxygalactose transaminase